MKKIKPMLLKSTDSICAGDYIYEIKLDGIRLIADSRDGKFTLYTRNGTDYSSKFNAIQNELQNRFSGQGIVFDGELVLLDNLGKPDFYNLLSVCEGYRSNNLPLFYFVFDILYLNGKNIMDKTLVERKSLLSKLFNEKTSPSIVEKIKKTDVFLDGNALFEAIKLEELEGIVAKKKNSPYLEGARDDSWLKLKVKKTMNVYIVGFVQGKRSVCLAKKLSDGTFLYVGNAGSGLNDKDFNTLKQKAAHLIVDISTQKNINWNSLTDKITAISPFLSLTVSYTELKPNGKLRNPTILNISKSMP